MVINFHVFIIGFAVALAMREIPPLNHFSMNKYMSMSTIFFNLTPVIFNITSLLNPGELK